MDLENILYKFNPWWEGEYSSHIIPREKYNRKLEESLDTDDVVIITGLRRVGKTSIMKNFIEALLKRVPASRIFYISLDAYGLEKYSIHDIVEAFRKIHHINLSDKIYIFLDEVTAKQDFQRELKDFYDNENIKIYTGGSSASVMKEKKAYLTGRNRVVEVLPLDFAEFLTFRNIKIKKSEQYLVDVYFEQYMDMGGIPEYIMRQDPVYLEGLIDDIIYKDIIGGHGIKEKGSVRDMFLLLMERSGKQVTLNKMAKILGISFDTVKRYMEYFLDTFIFYSIERCGKVNERIRSPKKLYAGDTGIRNIVTGFRDKGALFENLFFLKIKHQKPCYVFENGIELDFVVNKDTLIEIKYNRELNQKQKEMFDRHQAKNKLIISTVSQFLAYV
jgi:predicted AAA+ superfamily ATPase